MCGLSTPIRRMVQPPGRPEGTSCPLWGTPSPQLDLLFPGNRAVPYLPFVHESTVLHPLEDARIDPASKGLEL